MNRSIFVRVVTQELISLQQKGVIGGDIQRAATSIADRFEIVAQALDGLEGVPAVNGIPGFPPANPRAATDPQYAYQAPLATAPPAMSGAGHFAADSQRPPDPPVPTFQYRVEESPAEVSTALAAPPPGQGLIVPSTSLNDIDALQRDPRARSATPTPPPPPQMGVSELNLFLQQSTPASFTVQVQVDGGVRSQRFERNVISRHVENSVQLVYYPEGATQSVREGMQVGESFHVEDPPSDIRSLMERLKRQAAESILPRRIRQLPVDTIDGPVTPNVRYPDGKPTGQTPMDAAMNNAIFHSLGS